MRVELDDIDEEKRKVTVELQGEKVRLQVREKDKTRAEASLKLEELRRALGMLASSWEPEPEEPQEPEEPEE